MVNSQARHQRDRWKIWTPKKRDKMMSILSFKVINVLST